ncbi:hypothetical protein G6O69_14270 [Pseudenhygromyxa sp. WMMC2535]|uniref:hypothetical protein n=1 Tax=Pseudenhygromyxa sp. WMMC2535 TaxID=2712867 RepID=UPI0015521AE3|nr:hypothetical protein [Pseudenhygromyxa sp. WMMC2535]NVB39004.1 hypothetical protein [Pseudenhygromyxa sp. WMMC2535]
MHRRLVIPRLPEGSVPPPTQLEPRRVDAPSLAGVRLVFGVGSEADAPPSAADFHPVYTVSMPVVSAGGLDPDGIYEFDAGAQLELLQARARARRWGVRLELALAQRAEALSCADLYIDPPWPGRDGVGPRLELIGSPRGEGLPGGGRALTVASSVVDEVEAARRLGGRFTFQLRDADPHGGGPATVESPVQIVELHLGRYEFE